MKELWLKMSLLSRQEDVSAIVEEACRWLTLNGGNEEFTADVGLVLAEALNNVVEHAYSFREDGTIDTVLRFAAPKLEITIEDRGEKFPGVPTPKEMDGPEQEFDDLPEGGFGWFLIQSLTENVNHTRIAGRNHLKMFMTQSAKA